MPARSTGLDSYVLTVPAGMAERVGTLVVRLPCRLWSMGEDGKRVWGRRIVASWGAAPVPPLPGMTLTDPGLPGVTLYCEEAR